MMSEVLVGVLFGLSIGLALGWLLVELSSLGAVAGAAWLLLLGGAALRWLVVDGAAGGIHG